MKKIIITDGCSFTNWRTTWATLLKETTQYELFNLGRPGNSNDNVVGRFPEKFNRIHSDENFDKSAVLIQLTGLDRKMIGNAISPSIGKVFGQSKWKSGIFKLFGMENPDDGSGAVYDWESYFLNEYTPEKHINELLKNIIDLQSFFENLPDDIVEYKLLLGWDIFTTSDNNQWSTTDRYSNIDALLLKDEFESSKKYWEDIDWSKFWFYENENVKYGGISQWVQYNCEPEDWYQANRSYNDNPNDRHPTYKAHGKFKEEVIEPMIKEMLG